MGEASIHQHAVVAGGSFHSIIEMSAVARLECALLPTGGKSQREYRHIELT
jgi:hypothetical protein